MTEVGRFLSVAERRGGQLAATGVLIVGFLLLAIATVTGGLDASTFGLVAALVSGGLLLWSLLGYLLMRGARARRQEGYQATSAGRQLRLP